MPGREAARAGGPKVGPTSGRSRGWKQPQIVSAPSSTVTSRDGHWGAQRPGTAGNHSIYPNLTSCKHTPGPGLHTTWGGGPAWVAALVKREYEEELDWRGREAPEAAKAKARTLRRTS